MASDIVITSKFSIEFFPDRVQRLLDSPDGPVGAHVQRAAKKVHEVSQGLIGPRGYSGTTGRPKEARSGPLRSSGSVVNIGGAAWSVVYNHPIAFIHHNGATAHSYSAGLFYNRNPGTWRNSPFNDGHFALKGPFQHPGSKANPYLTKAAAQVGLRSSGSLMRGRTLTPIFRSGNFF